MAVSEASCAIANDRVSDPWSVGHRIADDLQIALPVVFAGTSTLYVTMGLCAPLLARPFKRPGARHSGRSLSRVDAVPRLVMPS
jgi:hypothetical protein